VHCGVLVAFSFRRVLYWAPRLLGIAFVIFLGYLSSSGRDIFNDFNGFAQTAAALLMHLVPSFIFAGVLLFAWKWEWVGATLFSAFAVYYAASNLRHPRWALTISGPLITVGLLFLASWLAHPKVEQVDKLGAFAKELIGDELKRGRRT
jgi:hypothetical protein